MLRELHSSVVPRDRDHELADARLVYSVVELVRHGAPLLVAERTQQREALHLLSRRVL